MPQAMETTRFMYFETRYSYEPASPFFTASMARRSIGSSLAGLLVVAASWGTSSKARPHDIVAGNVISFHALEAIGPILEMLSQLGALVRSEDAQRLGRGIESVDLHGVLGRFLLG